LCSAAVRQLIAAGIGPSRIWWLRLDHPLLLQESLGDLVRAVLDTSEATPDGPVFLMLDELVYTDRWDLWLKTLLTISGRSGSPRPRAPPLRLVSGGSKAASGAGPSSI